MGLVARVEQDRSHRYQAATAASATQLSRVRESTDVPNHYVDPTASEAFHGEMAQQVLTAAEALAATREPLCYPVRVIQREASGFGGLGWTMLGRPRDGSVTFVHRERELLAFRTRGIL